MRFRELVHARSGRHRSGDGDDFRIAVGKLGQRFAKHILVGRRPASRSLVLLAGNHVEFDDPMVFVGGALGGAIALALLRHHVDQHRADLGVADVLEHFDQRLHVVAVDRPDIIEAELVEQRAAGHEPARIFLDPASGAVKRLRERSRELLGELARRQIFAR